MFQEVDLAFSPVLYYPTPLFLACLELGGFPLIMKDDSIFSLRFGSKGKLEPSADELQAFLESRKPGSKELQGDDLAPYREHLSAVANYRKGSGDQRFQSKLLYTVLNHSHFANPALLSVVEQYKFHMHTLANLEFKKLAAFMQSAEEEIARLTSSKKKEESSRIDRLKTMIQDRKRAVESEKKRWLEFTEEMSHIISYVAENLSKIEKLCEQSIIVLVNEQIDRKKELALIEDIKNQFKDRLKESLHKGTIKKEDLEAAKEQVAALSKTTADFVRSDIYALTQLYETVHGHAKKIMQQLKQPGGPLHAEYEEDLQFYRNTEKILLSLVSDCRFTVKVHEIAADADQGGLLAEKRQQMFDHLVELLERS